MPVSILRNYVNGQWIDSKQSQYLDVENPSTGDIIARVPLSDAADTDRAVQAAQTAFPAWSRTPVARRVEYLYAFLNLMRNNEDAISRTLVEEMGKSLPDAHAEIKRSIQNVEVACGMPMLLQSEKLIGVADGIDGEIIRVPLGVFAMIAPFNFPAMVPFWFIPYALAAGNTYIVKPSEQVPCTMHVLAGLLEKAGFPPGVFNLVNGDKTVAKALLNNPLVKGVSFVGTTRICREVARTCAEKNTRFQAMGSAKNHLVVMPDARIDEVIRNMVTSCFGCAGQRCMAASAIVCVGDDTYHAVTERFTKAAREVVVANPLDPKVANLDVVMGPVISAKAKQQMVALIEEGIREGATLAVDGRNIQLPDGKGGHYLGPTVFTDVKPGMKIHSTEIFGPVVVILKADSLDDAIRIINAHEYGNGGSIYTQNGYYARKFKLETQVGMIGVNVGIPAPVAYLPFGGMKASLFADIKTQGKSAVDFFTEQKIITERYWEELEYSGEGRNEG